jgi:hypothetical protein
MTAHLDAEIDQQHAAAQAAEDRAVAIIERMRRIPGLTSLVDRLPRKFGEPPNPYKAGSRNLTVAGVLEISDPALAHHLATLAGTTISAPDYTAKAEAEARVAAAERLQAATEQLRQQNAQARVHREHLQALNVDAAGRRRF